jgi:hypothetical protein
MLKHKLKSQQQQSKLQGTATFAKLGARKKIKMVN